MATTADSSLPRYLIIDGGLGGEILERLQLTFKDRLWGTRAHFKDKEAVNQIHLDFLEAGADVIMTNTYKPMVKAVAEDLGMDLGAARDFFRNIAKDTCALRDQFWQSAKDKSPGRIRPLVAGSLGPYSAGVLGGTDYCGAYIDNTSVKDMTDSYREKAQLLLDGGVDILAFETIPAPKEGQAICELMKEFPGAKAWIAYCCKDDDHVNHGETFKDAVMTSLQSDQVVGVGVNCSKPQYMTSLLKQIPDVVRERKKIVVYPNNGQVFNTDIRRWEGDSESRAIHEYVSDWLKAGANWIGGCCNVSPKDIAPLRGEMDKYLASET